MRLLLKLLLVLVIAGVLGLAGYRVWQTTREKPAARGAAVAVIPVEVAMTRIGTMRDTAKFDGTLEAPQSFTVSPKIAGRLVTLLKDVGDSVNRSELVATLDDDEYRQEVAQQEAELKVQEANVALAKAERDAAMRDYEREKTLYAQRVTPLAAFDRIEVALKTKEAQLLMAESLLAKSQAALDLARTRRSYTRVHAEWEGDDTVRYVGDRVANVGDTLRAHDVICTIVNLEVLSATISVTEIDYAKLARGAPVLVAADALPGRVFHGKVTRVPPILSREAREARVEVEVPNDEKQNLKPGMFVRTIIEFGSRENASIVPETALTRYNGVEGVFVAEPKVGEDGQPAYVARFVPITRGLKEAAMEGGVGLVEIAKPANFSGRVVTVGQQMLSDGASISFTEVREVPANEPDETPPPATPPAKAEPAPAPEA